MEGESVNLCGIIILEKLARGSHIVIYKAQRGTKYIVLKAVLNPDAMLTEMLRREYELGKRLSHPSIVNTLDFLEDTEVGPAIVMEYIEGVTLERYLSQNPSRTARNRVLNDILEGVEYLHRQAIFHNDLKLTNIIVNRNGSARIIDFGLSLSDDSAYKGCFGGTQGSSAPEVLNGEGECSCGADIYSLGAIIDAVYGGKSLRGVVKRCRHSDVERRYRNIGELSRAIFWQRYMGVVLATAVAVLALVALVVAPHITGGVKQLQESRSRVEIEARMKGVYEPVFKALSQQKYSEFAFLEKTPYYLHYQQYHDSLTGHDRRICEEIFARDVATLDSVAKSKPSFMTLPDEERARMIEEFNNFEVKF